MGASGCSAHVLASLRTRSSSVELQSESWQPWKSAVQNPTERVKSTLATAGHGYYRRKLSWSRQVPSIRYAAAPTGSLRWKAPRLPASQNNAPITSAVVAGPICPQAYPSVPGVPFIPGNEDCLFLNVFAPASAQGLPVLVWIHGGGYGLGDASQDMTEIINANNKGFIVVSIQYRLGAFGFLASSEVKKRGVVNAGILDQAFALSWVKQFICKFGGDPLTVTISGESAGASSVMYHGIAADGQLGTLLFDKSIAASPYLPFQYGYGDAVPTSNSGDVFACLESKDSDTLQQANFDVTQQATYGYWAFWPVTDEVYITDRASLQLGAKRVNGRKLLVGHSANEGPLFAPPTIVTESDLTGWLQLEFPNLSSAQISSIFAANPNAAATSPGPLFETDGIGAGYTNAVNVSQDANGQQQRGNNIYAEATFVCPSYWMAAAYSRGGPNAAYHYQYSVPFAFHGADVAAYIGPAGANLGSDFALAFRRAWGNFITTGNPSISNAVANGASAANVSAANAASAWPAWSEAQPSLVNLNQTGGTPYQLVTQWGVSVTQFAQPGLRNAISVVANANAWEGGRGDRCAFYKSLAPSIPA
ncbi:Alpha/Beta hydrolase protein [Lasiosphaeris hirsuta]|uniref:Carboxylic ester hydrolase n=1 Tax=Lasiosphaeris hirsuta TaxID=260670 RepID=A0AA40AA66_9PEZI|nr:Alpha/Beta hydrolase protein [Lasiosphaeris hirsuta]